MEGKSLNPGRSIWKGKGSVLSSPLTAYIDDERFGRGGEKLEEPCKKNSSCDKKKKLREKRPREERKRNGQREDEKKESQKSCWSFPAINYAPGGWGKQNWIFP